MSNKILVVDDETEIADLIEVYLKNENYTVFKFYTAQEALNCIETTPIDLAILDIMLPDIDGFTLCKKIREHHTYPIIMLTAKDAETDKITGLTLGADDYITKPFRPLEMIARVKSQLRRYQKYNPAHSDTGETSSAASEDNLVCGSLTMNIKAHTCFLGENALGADTYGVFDPAYSSGKYRECSQFRRFVSQNLAGRVLQQIQQHHHRSYPPPAGENGR